MKLIEVASVAIVPLLIWPIPSVRRHMDINDVKGSAGESEGETMRDVGYEQGRCCEPSELTSMIALS